MDNFQSKLEWIYTFTEKLNITRTSTVKFAVGMVVRNISESLENWFDDDNDDETCVILGWRKDFESSHDDVYYTVLQNNWSAKTVPQGIAVNFILKACSNKIK